MGSALMGSLAFSFVVFDRGTFRVLPLTYFYLPKSARAYLFPKSVKQKHYFCSRPINVDPICPQPRLHLGGPPPIYIYIYIYTYTSPGFSYDKLLLCGLNLYGESPNLEEPGAHAYGLSFRGVLCSLAILELFF